MKIRLVSDCHNEHRRKQGHGKLFYPIPLDTDNETVLVLNGDIDTLIRVKDYAEKLAERFRAVIYVAGNHELYGFNFTELHTMWSALPNCFFLNNSTVMLDDVLFVGSTLWTSLDNGDDITSNYYNERWPDAKYIGYGSGNFTSQHVVCEHNYSVKFIQQSANIPARKRVCITHFAPTFCVADPKFNNSMSNNYYYSNLDYLIPEYDVWMYGHNHYNLDIMCGDCRVVSNQVGYTKEANYVDYNPNMIIEV